MSLEMGLAPSPSPRRGRKEDDEGDAAMACAPQWDEQESKSLHEGEANGPDLDLATKEPGLVTTITRRDDGGTLSMGDKLLGDSGCIRLMEEIASSNSLVRLDLRGNHIGSDGADAIADALRTNRSLRFLSLEWNRIGAFDGGVRRLASSLEINQTLQDLDLRNNQLGPDGGLSIARALRKNSGLRRLDLRWNEVGTSGGRALASAVSEANHTVREVLITGNGVIGVHAQALKEALKRNACPHAQEAVDDEKLTSIARRLRLSSEVATSCESAEDLVLVTREAAKKLQRDEEAEDHHVFADRVVELEVQVKRLQDALEHARANLVSERDARNDVLQQVKTAHAQAASALEEKERSHNALLKERSDCKMALDEAERAKARAVALEAERSDLRDRVGELEASEGSLRRGVEREVQLRTSVEEALAAIREERASLLERLDQERAHASAIRESAFKERLQLEEENARARDEAAAEVRRLEQQLAETRAAHVAEVDAIRQERDRLEEKVASVAREGAEEVIRQVTEARVVHGEELVRAQQAADAARKEALDRLKREHHSEVSRLETEHEARTAREVALACEQAVEKALAETVRVEVAKASKELTAEHKRSLWDCEKRIREEAKLQAEALVDKHECEVSRLEAEVARAKEQLRDAEMTHREDFAKLQERARRALGDVFRLPSTASSKS